MKEVIQLCHKSNKSELLKHKDIKRKITEMTKALQIFKIDVSCKCDLDYFKLSIISQGLLAKQFIQDAYEEVGHEMFEIWQTLEYKTRNEFANKALKEKKVNYPHFDVDNATIYIPFFDELTNIFYDREVAMLQLPQYFRLYKDFKDKMIDVGHYKWYPYEYGFLDVQYLGRVNELFAIYVKENHKIYFIESDQVKYVFPLSLKHRCQSLDVERVKPLLEAIANQEETALIQWCLNSGQIDEKTKKACIKLLKKVKK